MPLANNLKFNIMEQKNHTVKLTIFNFILLFVFLLTANTTFAQKKPEVNNLTANYLTNPLSINNKAPLLSWEIQSSSRGVEQIAYQIIAALSEKELKSEKNLLWNSGKMDSNQSTQIEYRGKPLQSSQRIFWQVKIWDNQTRTSAWSKPAFFETGLLNASDWKADWIEPNITEDKTKSGPSIMLRKEFELKKEIKSAKIYITSHGLYQLNLNGQKVSDELFTPGWTSYNKRLQYQVFDLSSQVKKGNNAIGVILGDGWYRGYLVWKENRNCYGSKLAVIAQLKVIYNDGTEELITTDNTWKSSTGAILASDIYNGETYDARLEQKGWDQPGFIDTKWYDSSVKDFDKQILIASEGVPVRIHEIIKPVKKFTTPKGELVFDMGQNMVGWLQFKLKGKAGEKISMKFAEVLDKSGNFYTTNLRNAKVSDQYIFKGEGIETYEPHFTFHGFRYVMIENYTGEINLEDLTGKVIYSDMPFTGSFECSDSLINQLQHNIQWGLRGNFLDVPTDCPQRDERLGWTADAQVFTPTACFNVNGAAFFTKWMKDFIADQRADGAVPHVVPNVIGDGYGSTAWGDAATIIPWGIYSIYGDKRILETQYQSMKAWVEYMRVQTANTGFIFNTGYHFGDWLAFSTNRSDYPGATTDKDLAATAYFARSTKILQQTAELLDKKADADNYKQLLENIKNAFQKEFITPTGRLSSNTQTAYVLALSNDLIPEELRTSAANRLANDVKKFGHITTGFLGTPDICSVLTRFGHDDLAYMLLFRKEYPSWLYPISKGATTIWERWDGIKTDGSFQDPGMNSFNHYAYGAVGNWLYTTVAGIASASPGYKNIIIHPHPTEKLSYAKANYHSIHGEIASSWTATKGKLNTLEVVVPANTKATIHIPAQSSESITESGLPLSKVSSVKVTGSENGNILMEVGSGKYLFEVR